MIEVELTPQSVAKSTDYLRAIKTRILEGAKQGMQISMEGLSHAVADKLHGDPITSRTGELLEGVLNGVSVEQQGKYIVGRVSPKTPGKPNLALWLEEGHAFPGQRNRFLEAKNLIRLGTHASKLPNFQQYLSDRITGNNRVRAYPFMNPALAEYEPTILANIINKIMEAVHE